MIFERSFVVFLISFWIAGFFCRMFSNGNGGSPCWAVDVKLLFCFLGKWIWFLRKLLIGCCLILIMCSPSRACRGCHGWDWALTCFASRADDPSCSPLWPVSSWGPIQDNNYLFHQTFFSFLMKLQSAFDAKFSLHWNHNVFVFLLGSAAWFESLYAHMPFHFMNASCSTRDVNSPPSLNSCQLHSQSICCAFHHFWHQSTFNYHSHLDQQRHNVLQFSSSNFAL